MRHISSGHVADSSVIADDATITNVNDQKIYSSNSNIEKLEKESANKIESEETQYGSQSVSTTPVELEPHEDPKNMSPFRKWVAVVVISSASLCATCASSMAASAETGESRDFHVSKIVTILGISLYVEGLGCGPLLLGPLSEFFGRTPIYLTSYLFFFAFSFPVAFAPNIAVFLVFRFLTGFSSAAFLSVAGGSVSDLFTNDKVANPMAFYTISPFAGPVIGPLISGFINQNVSWRWTYYVLIIWIFVELVALYLFVPETYAPVLLKKKSRRLRRLNGLPEPEEVGKKAILHAIALSCYKPFELLLFDRMALLLDLWSALILGILYLAFQAFPIIFGEHHSFSSGLQGCSFLGIGIGLVLGSATQPFWNRLYKQYTIEHDGHPPPEMRLLMGMPGGILVSLGLFIIAFTTFPGVHWIGPIIGSIPFGTGIILVYTAVFTYLVTAYRPIAASAMAANSALRSAFAAAFPLFAPAMYHRLGTVGATALLGGLTTIMAPLPFIFYKYGPRIRQKSKYATS